MVYVQAIPLAMATLRNVHNICPAEVHQFLLDLFKYNDNSQNKVVLHFIHMYLVCFLKLKIRFVNTE